MSFGSKPFGFEESKPDILEILPGRFLQAQYAQA